MIIAETRKRSAKDFIAVVPRNKKRRRKKDIAIPIWNTDFEKNYFVCVLKTFLKKI